MKLENQAIFFNNQYYILKSQNVKQLEVKFRDIVPSILYENHPQGVNFIYLKNMEPYP